jgi:nucleoid DNA-binding protein
MNDNFDAVKFDSLKQEDQANMKSNNIKSNSIKSITKKDIVEYMCQNIKNTEKMSKTEISEIFDDIVKILSQTLISGEAIKCMNFGTFNVKTRQARMGYNPYTGQKTMLKPSVGTYFHASTNVSAKLNKDNNDDYFF